MDAELITYITPEPEAYEYGLQDDNLRFVPIEGGYGMAPVEYIADKGFQQHGETPFGFRLQPRIITLKVSQKAESLCAHWERRAELLNILRQNRQAINTFNPGRIRKYLPCDTVAAGIDRWVATGEGTNTLAYSDDGIHWTGLGNAIFNVAGIGVAYNGDKWVAVGQSANTIAYSYDGISWVGLGNAIFTTAGLGVAWNGSMWIAVGQGGNTIAYSYDGINWAGLGATTFTAFGADVAWNGNMWVAVGDGVNRIAYSYDGLNWTGLGLIMFSVWGAGVAWGGGRWVAVGEGAVNTMAWSNDGINWNGLGLAIFDSIGYGVAWNGSIWVAVGEGSVNTIAWSNNGIAWNGLGTTIYATRGLGVAWNGTMWVTVGHNWAGNKIAYSYNGVDWTGLGDIIFGTTGRDVASAPAPALMPAILGMPGGDIVDSRKRDLWVLYESGLIFDDDPDHADQNVEDIVSFVAHDPVWFDPEIQSRVWAIVVEEGWILDTVPSTLTDHWIFPFLFGPAIVTESQNITYVGTWLTYPTIIIEGPAQHPLIENRTTGEKLELAYDVSPLETVTFNLEYGQKAVLSDTAGNLTKYLTSDSDLATFHLEPDPGAPGGVNEIYVQFSGHGVNSAVTMQWYVRYIGI